MEKRTRKAISLRAAINAMCKQCIHDPKEEAWRKKVEVCAATDYPLYPVRPRFRSKKS